jgi:hypothetical protein
MPADDDDHLGPQFLYHGTRDRWAEVQPISPRRPLHVATDPDFPADYAEPGGVIKKFRLDPAARIHRTESSHLGAEQPLSDEEHAMVMREGFDVTLFNEGSLGVVWNADVLRPQKDISSRDYRERSSFYRRNAQKAD